jgi:hypothetical protein
MLSCGFPRLWKRLFQNPAPPTGRLTVNFESTHDGFIRSRSEPASGDVTKNQLQPPSGTGSGKTSGIQNQQPRSFNRPSAKEQSTVGGDDATVCPQGAEPGHSCTCRWGDPSLALATVALEATDPATSSATPGRSCLRFPLEPSQQRPTRGAVTTGKGGSPPLVYGAECRSGLLRAERPSCLNSAISRPISEVAYLVGQVHGLFRSSSELLRRHPRIALRCGRCAR